MGSSIVRHKGSYIFFKKIIEIDILNNSLIYIHHLVNWITEKDFELYLKKEFFYEGLDGVTSDTRSENNPPNSIICISSASDLGPVKELVNYLVPAWKPEFLEKLGLLYSKLENKLKSTVTELNSATEEIKILKNKLIISEEEKSIFLKLYRKFK